MGENIRKPLSKSERYEILKRDSFTCQYCGRMAPEVILEVDHIIPVAEGGSNDSFNLITSCRDCNRGKGKKQLSDHSAIDKQKEMLRDVNEMREQLEMMVEWRHELDNLMKTQIDILVDYWDSMTGGDNVITIHGERKLKMLIKQFGFNEVYESMEIALDQYCLAPRGGKQTFAYAFDKIGGICYNRRYQANNRNDGKSITDEMEEW